MNVYEVQLSSEKAPTENWITQGTVPSVAIRIALRGTKHRTAKRLHVSAKLIAQNMTFKEWKEIHGDE